MSKWQPINTAPTLDRVYVAGWQKQIGRCAAYWWHGEDTTDERGIPMEHPSALLWQPLPDPPKTLPTSDMRPRK
jgi:hypothetical protein